MKTLPKYILIIALAQIAIIFVVSGGWAFRQFKQDIVSTQYANQQKMTRIINQSLKLYFDELRFITENLANHPAFSKVEANIRADSIRYKPFKGDKPEKIINREGINRILHAKPNQHFYNWQVFKGLPEKVNGKLIAEERRLLVRNSLRAFRDIHYIFEMDKNGDLVFLEPFDTQKNITSFNYEFRDYLRLVKANKKSALSEGYISHDVNRTQIITMATPIFDETHQVVRVIGASISAATVRDRVFKTLRESISDGLNDGTVFYLVDRHGHGVASSSGKNIFFPVEGNQNDEGDFGNFRSLGFFKQMDWTPDVLEKGNLWERKTRSWLFGSLKRDYSGIYKNFDGQQVFASFFPAPIVAEGDLNWGILIETPVSQLLKSENSLIFYFTLAILVLVLLLGSLSCLIFNNIKKLETEILTKEKELKSVTAQVAHDIRSPLAALEVFSNTVDQVPDSEKAMLKEAVSRIKDISHDLMIEYKPKKSGLATPASLIKCVISEKREKFRHLTSVEISFVDEVKHRKLLIDVDSSEFKRVLSNLIDNAVESLNEVGRVFVTLKSYGSYILIQIMDNGSGIPKEIVERIGHEAKSMGKEGGLGLGLMHAYRSVKSWGGSLEVSPRLEMRGTRIAVVLPMFS
jgi:signal transduction histidine kinase